MLLLRSLLLAGALLSLPTLPDLAKLAPMVDEPSARLADTLDVVSSGGQLSHVAYEARLPPSPPYLPSPLPRLHLKPQLKRFGSITGSGGVYRTTGPPGGGLRLDLGSTNRLRNLLAYQNLQLTGNWTGTWQVGLADAGQARRGEQTHIGFLNQQGAIFPLNQVVAAQTDLSRARYLVFNLTTAQGKLSLSGIDFTRAEIPPLPPRHGVWILTAKALRAPEDVARDLAAKGFRRAYVQITETPASLYPFIRAASERGIEVYALDGSPDDLQHGAALLGRVAEIAAYNRTYAEAPFAGLQLDIAPHDLRDLGIRREFYAQRYLALLNEIAVQSGSILPLSLIVPPEMLTIPANGVNLMAKTLALTNELVITGDRTSYTELVERSRIALQWGERFGKPVFIGIRIGPVPDEGHLILRKNGKRNGKRSISLAGMQWVQEKAYTIPAAAVSFNGREADLVDLLAKHPPSPAFAGWVLNSYEYLNKTP